MIDRKNNRESLWWKDLKRVWALEEWENNFEDKVTWELGDGDSILFWEDKWVENGVLRVLFPRIFNISSSKMANLA